MNTGENKENKNGSIKKGIGLVVLAHGTLF